MLNAISIYEGLLKPIDLQMLAELEIVFQSLNYTDHQLEVNEPEMLGSSISDTEKAQTVLAVYEKHVDLLLLLFGVYVMDDPDRVDMHFKADLIHFLNACTELDNVDLVSQVLTDAADDEDEDILTELLSRLMGKDKTYYDIRIESVDERLIGKMKTSTASPAFFGDVIETSKRIKTRLAGFYEDVKEGTTYERIIRSNSLPLTYATAYAAVSSELEDLSSDRAAFEVIAMLIATGMTNDDIPELGRELIENALAGDGKLLQVLASFNRQLAGLPNEEE